MRRRQTYWEYLAFARRASALRADIGLRARIRERDGSNCRYCADSVEWYGGDDMNFLRNRKMAVYEHIDPHGPNSEVNVVIACKSCNSRKGSRTPEQAGMVLVPVGFQVPPECYGEGPDDE